MFTIRLFALPEDEPRLKHSPQQVKVLEETIQECLGQGLDERILVCIASCSGLELLQKWEFQVSGFGEVPWRTHLDPDLSLLIDDLPEAAARLERGEDAKIVFSESSLQRTVFLHPRNSKVVEVRCTSAHPKWNPEPQVYYQDLNSLVTSLRDVFRVYYEAVKQHCPDVFHCRVFQEWVRLPEVAACLPEDPHPNPGASRTSGSVKGSGLWSK